MSCCVRCSYVQERTPFPRCHYARCGDGWHQALRSAREMATCKYREVISSNTSLSTEISKEKKPFGANIFGFLIIHHHRWLLLFVTPLAPQHHLRPWSTAPSRILFIILSYCFNSCLAILAITASDSECVVKTAIRT